MKMDYDVPVWHCTSNFYGTEYIWKSSISDSTFSKTLHEVTCLSGVAQLCQETAVNSIQ